MSDSRADVKVAGRAPVELVLEPGEYFFCCCGRSASQPFCDGSHKGTGLKPLRFVVEEKQNSFFCLCKQTDNPPYCDGSHHDLDD
ncbi:MAG: CDGSH iron-sulfur domain-containing protein [Motiliproteus sp.]